MKALALLVVAASMTLHGQVAFDVASVKESTSLETGGSLFFLPEGGVRASNMAARGLISIAYELESYQLLNAPAWSSDTRYNIEAKPADKATREQTSLMLQALLAERFKLTFHREKREVDGFALVRAQKERLGPQLRVSEFDCQNQKAFQTTPACRSGRVGGDQARLIGTTPATIVQIVVNTVRAPVSDETGLTGRYDVDLHWSNEVAPTDDRPSIYQALQDQLGLKLERRRVMTDVFIVDRLERAAPD